MLLTEFGNAQNRMNYELIELVQMYHLGEIDNRVRTVGSTSNTVCSRSLDPFHIVAYYLLVIIVLFFLFKDNTMCSLRAKLPLTQSRRGITVFVA